jgi:hypothetical protein
LALLKQRWQIRWLCLLAGAAPFAAGQAQSIDEYQVKAAFLYNFVKFVDWPAEEFKNPSDPIVICVLGRNPFGTLLESSVAGKHVGGRSLVVRAMQDLHEAAACQLLFIAASEKKRVSTIIDVVRTDSVLTVGESPNFTGAGGIINFKLEEGKVGLEINVYAAHRAKLQISSKLLSLARVIKDDKQ